MNTTTTHHHHRQSTTRAGYRSITPALLDATPTASIAPVHLTVTETPTSTTGLRHLLDSLTEGDTLIADADDLAGAIERDASVAEAIAAAGARGVRVETDGLPGVPCTLRAIKLLAEAQYQALLGTVLAEEAAMEGRGTPVLHLPGLHLSETPEARAAWDRARLLRSIVRGLSA